MAATLIIDGRNVAAPVGATLFDCAEELGVRVPTSCQKQGRCKECLVEVSEGMDALSARTAEEKHLAGRFRLSCRTRVVTEGATVECHTMRRGEMRIDVESCSLPGMARFTPDAPEFNGYGIAADLGTTTVVLRLYDLQT